MKVSFVYPSADGPQGRNGFSLYNYYKTSIPLGSVPKQSVYPLLSLTLSVDCWKWAIMSQALTP